MPTPEPPPLQGIDHIHIFVSDRAAAETWYRAVLGFARISDYAHWAADGGPLTIQDAQGCVHLALFERPPQACRSTVALRVDGAAFRAWKKHLDRVLPGAVKEEDHEQALSMYFEDPDGNPYEITTYDVAPRSEDGAAAAG